LTFAVDVSVIARDASGAGSGSPTIYGCAGFPWLRVWRFAKWLPPGHDCVPAATLTEDLTVIAASSCARRFLATPLDEIIPS
jgi:hypothetical protein